MMKLLASWVVMWLFFSASAEACTSAVVSGKVTPDGRPLLWKHRDTGFLRNHMAYVQGEKYDFIANVNSDNFPSVKEAWMGTNEAGFALMNTQSYNLVDVKEGEERGVANGRMIYRALEVCATVGDFCHFLDTIAKPSGIEANFGAIDAQGAAVMLEVDDYHYVVYDANNPKDAPYGYVARTNFSFSGKVNQGAGYVRYMEAEQVLMKASATGGIAPDLILNKLSRSFRNSLLDIDLRKGDFNSPNRSGWFVDQDFIPRRSTSSSIVVQGVKPGEPAELTTMWTVLGYPPTGVVFPLWVKGADQYMPLLMTLDDTCGAAPLSHWSLRLADEVFCYRQGMGTDRYFYWERLYSPATGGGYLLQLAPVEAEVFHRTSLALQRWRENGGVLLKEQRNLYRVLEAYLRNQYALLLP